MFLKLCLNEPTRHSNNPAENRKPHSSFLTDFDSDFAAISKPTDCVFPFDFRERVQKQTGMKLEIMGTERALLGFLLAKVYKVDPDVIVVSPLCQ